MVDAMTGTLLSGRLQPDEQNKLQLQQHAIAQPHAPGVRIADSGERPSLLHERKVLERGYLPPPIALAHCVLNYRCPPVLKSPSDLT
jgi:hypothetical protein